MTDASTPKQASEPNQTITASQQAQVHAPPNPGGSALLDANIAAGETTNPQADEFAEPIATNFSAGTGSGDEKTANASTVAGPYSGDPEQAEKGRVHLQNNPNPPDQNVQGTLPDTDQMVLPLDPETNLPD